MKRWKILLSMGLLTLASIVCMFAVYFRITDAKPGVRLALRMASNETEEGLVNNKPLYSETSMGERQRSRCSHREVVGPFRRNVRNIKAENLYRTTSAAHRNLLLEIVGNVEAKPFMAMQSVFMAEVDGTNRVYDLENQIKEYFRKSTLSQQLDVMSVVCSKSYCEVQSMVYMDSPSDNWFNSIDEMRSDAIWHNFSADSAIVSDENGFSVVFAYLQRNGLELLP